MKLRILRLFWVIRVGSMCSHVVRRRQEIRVSRRRERNEVGMMQRRGHKPRSAGSLWKLRDEWAGFSLGALRGNQPC